MGVLRAVGTYAKEGLDEAAKITPEVLPSNATVSKLHATIRLNCILSRFAHPFYRLRSSNLAYGSCYRSASDKTAARLTIATAVIRTFRHFAGCVARGWGTRPATTGGLCSIGERNRSPVPRRLVRAAGGRFDPSTAQENIRS